MNTQQLILVPKIKIAKLFMRKLSLTVSLGSYEIVNLPLFKSPWSQDIEVDAWDSVTDMLFFSI